MIESTRVFRGRIVIDAIPLLGPLTGVGHYTTQLIHGFRLLSPEYEYLYYYGYFSKAIFCGNEATNGLKQSLFRIPGFEKSFRYAISNAPRLYWKGFDLYFEPNFIPIAMRTRKLVTTVHDFSFRLFPEAHPRDRIDYFEKNFAKGVKRSDHIITVSEHVRAEALDFLRVAPELVTSVPLGVEHQIFRLHDKPTVANCRAELGLPEKFLLFVGTREPRKNLSRLLDAYLELPEWMKKEFGLVLVGPEGWSEAGLKPRLEQIGKRALVLGYVDQQRLAQIYNSASLFVFPSYYEGFGLPPLEAMACGCPVVVSRVASLPEVCGEAAYYVDPEDVSSIAEGICHVLTDEALRKSLISSGLERAKLFSWEQTARKTLDVFEEVMERKE
jgi:glycosyltransferase involved in cell wall biosynthesis